MILEFKDTALNPVCINITHISVINCDSEIILTNGVSIRIEMPYEELKRIVYENLIK